MFNENFTEGVVVNRVWATKYKAHMVIVEVTTSEDFKTYLGVGESMEVLRYESDVLSARNRVGMVGKRRFL